MTVDYPQAIDRIITDPAWVFTDALAGLPGNKLSIVNHKTASPGQSTALSVAAFFHNDTVGHKSSHFIIDRDGTVVQVVRLKDGAGGNCCLEAGHDPYWDTYKTTYGNLNRCTFSIEHIDQTVDNSQPMPQKQTDASCALNLWLCQRYHIPASHIKGHSSLDPVNKARCPGPTFPLAELVAYVEQHVQQQGGGQPMPALPTTPGGENAVFHDGVTQLEGGETEEGCVAFSASNIWHATQPGKANPYTYEDIDQMADHWYAKLTGSINNSDGMSEAQLHTMLDGMGLKYEPIPLSHTPADDERVRVALRAGKLVIICAAESSFFDLDIGRPPYSWNTKPFNHAIVASGLITSGPYAGNVWVRDTVAVSGGYTPSTKRPYDLGKMQYVSLTAVVPGWLTRGGITMTSGVPAGWHDDSKTLTAPNGHKVVQGFRAHILAGPWDAQDVPLEEEHQAALVEEYYPSGPGAVQTFNYTRLGYTPAKGVYKIGIGNELLGCEKALGAALQVLPPVAGGAPQVLLDDIKKLVVGFEQLKKDAGIV